MNGDFQSDYKHGNTIVVVQSPNPSSLPSPNSSIPPEVYEMIQRSRPDNNGSNEIMPQPIDIEKEHIITPKSSANPEAQNVPRDVNNKKLSLPVENIKIYSLCKRENAILMNVGNDFNSIWKIW